jgi:hypothetical protein
MPQTVAWVSHSPPKLSARSPGKETEEEVKVTGSEDLLLLAGRLLLEKHFLSPSQRVTNWPNQVRNHLVNVQEVSLLSADVGSFFLLSIVFYSAVIPQMHTRTRGEKFRAAAVTFYCTQDEESTSSSTFQAAGPARQAPKGENSS